MQCKPLKTFHFFSLFSGGEKYGSFGVALVVVDKHWAFVYSDGDTQWTCSFKADMDKISHSADLLEMEGYFQARYLLCIRIFFQLFFRLVVGFFSEHSEVPSEFSKLQGSFTRAFHVRSLNFLFYEKN